MNKYYVYCLLDPGKPGEFNYNEISFDYEPFYIGKGTGKRINAHFYPSSLKLKSYKNNKIKKILESNLKPIIKIIYENINEELAYEIENRLISNIGRHNINNGPLCNLTDGGKGALNAKNIEKYKKVCKFSLCGEFLDEYDSITQASEINNLFIENISRCCLGKANTHGGFFWSFKKENNYFIKDRRNKEIHQFDLDGNLINKYASITEAALNTGIIHSHISLCCNGVLLKIKKTYFRYCDNIFPLKSKKLTNRPILKIESDNIIEFESLKKASEVLNISTKNIIERCKKSKYYDNLYLIYKDEYMKGIRKDFVVKGNGEKRIKKVSTEGDKIWEYSSIAEASEKENISRSKIYNLIKKNIIMYVDE
jgi:hypothetical protein